MSTPYVNILYITINKCYKVSCKKTIFILYITTVVSIIKTILITVTPFVRVDLVTVAGI